MTRRECLAECVLQSRGLMMRYTAGFTESNYTAVANGLPNHLAWILGHCALTMHRAAERVDGHSPLDDDFIFGDDRGDGNRFGAESVAFGSDPSNAGVIWPSLARCIQVFSNACDRLSAALSSAEDSRLDDLTTFVGGMSLPRWSVAPRIVFHNGTHCGQIADLRRALGFAPIFG